MEQVRVEKTLEDKRVSQAKAWNNRLEAAKGARAEA